jgi:hypothetical protein
VSGPRDGAPSGGPRSGGSEPESENMRGLRAALEDERAYQEAVAAELRRGTIRLLPNGWYRATAMVDGEEVAFHAFATEAEADAWLAGFAAGAEADA